MTVRKYQNRVEIGSWAFGSKPYAFYMCQQYSSNGVVKDSASDWLCLSYDSRKGLITALGDHATVIRKILSHFTPLATEKVISGHKAEEFLVGFGPTSMFTIDDLDAKHIRALQKIQLDLEAKQPSTAPNP